MCDQIKFEPVLLDSWAVGDKASLEFIFRPTSVFFYIDAITLCCAVKASKSPVVPHPLRVAVVRDQHMRLERDACMCLT